MSTTTTTTGETPSNVEGADAKAATQITSFEDAVVASKFFPPSAVIPLCTTAGARAGALKAFGRLACRTWQGMDALVLAEAAAALAKREAGTFKTSFRDEGPGGWPVSARTGLLAWIMRCSCFDTDTQLAPQYGSVQWAAMVAAGAIDAAFVGFDWGTV